MSSGIWSRSAPPRFLVRAYLLSDDAVLRFRARGEWRVTRVLRGSRALSEKVTSDEAAVPGGWPSQLSGFIGTGRSRIGSQIS
jgi:hypothetical protein